MRLRLLLVTFPFLLAGCSSLSEEECRSISWYNLGYQDGQQGHTRDALGSYQKSCSEYGVKVDEAEWQRGYAKGLELYCIPELAYRKGVNGEQYQGVCPNDATFLKQYQRGRQEYEVNQRMQSLQQELYRIEQQLGAIERRLHDNLSDAEREDYRSQRRYLQRQAEYIRQELFQLRNPPTVIQFNFQ